MDFFNKITGQDDKKPARGEANATTGGRVSGGGNSGSSNNKGNGPQFANPFKNLNVGVGSSANRPGGKNYRGGGQSLGGSKPGRIIRVELPLAGPLGVKVEKRPGSSQSAIVSQVLPNTQAAQADLQRGDIICVADTDGEVEMRFDDFLKLAKEDARPLIFDVRRIDVVVPGTSSNAAAGGKGKSSASADAYAKRQAVIAAAEARDRAHKTKTRPIAKKAGGRELTGAEKKRIEEQREEVARKNAAEGIGTANMSEEAKRAVAAVKKGEEQHAAELGYNPYETNNLSAGQARTATVAVSHGALNAGGGGGGGESSSAAAAAAAPGAVAPPANPTTAATETQDTEEDLTHIDPQFDEAFEAVALHNDGAAVASITTMRKLIVNATTKGQQGDADDEKASKFRRVRLSNAKIRAAVTDVHGALDLMFSVGFVLSENEEDGETYLVFPPGSTGPSWLPKALRKMESYSK